MRKFKIKIYLKYIEELFKKMRVELKIGAGEGIRKLHSVLVCHNLQRFLGKVHCKFL